MSSWISEDYFVGVANTSSFANRLFESANKVQVNGFTKMYPTTTGVILQGSNSTTTYSGTNIIARPLNHSSFSHHANLCSNSAVKLYKFKCKSIR